MQGENSEFKFLEYFVGIFCILIFPFHLHNRRWPVQTASKVPSDWPTKGAGKVGPWKLLNFCGYISKKLRKGPDEDRCLWKWHCSDQFGGLQHSTNRLCFTKSMYSTDISQNSTLIKVIFWLKLKNPGVGMKCRSWSLLASWLFIQESLWMLIALVRGQPDKR